ncbi:MAG: hypothetical protein AABY32_05570 [Nanoarchaeota archaeon]
MSKDKLKVNFHDRKMNLLEARLYSCGLRLGIINVDLNEEEIKDYHKWEDEQYIKNRKVKEIISAEEKISEKSNERQYLIEELKNQIRLTKNAKSKAYCEKYGHKEMKGSSDIRLSASGARVHVLCSKCNAMYERAPTKEELEKANKITYNPFHG